VIAFSRPREPARRRYRQTHQAHGREIQVRESGQDKTILSGTGTCEVVFATVYRRRIAAGQATSGSHEVTWRPGRIVPNYHKITVLERGRQSILTILAERADRRIWAARVIR
jgi:hypothetical protein